MHVSSLWFVMDAGCLHFLMSISIPSFVSLSGATDQCGDYGEKWSQQPLLLYKYQRCSSVQFWVNHKFVKEGSNATTDKMEGRGTLSLSPGPVMTSSTQQEWCITDNLLAIQSVEGIFRHGLPDGDVTIKQHNKAEIKACDITKAIP